MWRSGAVREFNVADIASAPNHNSRLVSSLTKSMSVQKCKC